MKTTVIYHSADFDGIFCREIARKFLPPDTEFIGWNFGDSPIKTERQGPLYIMDLPLDAPLGLTNPNWIEQSIEKGQTLIWIDHHKTSIETHPKDIPGYRIDGVAACRLAWQWFYRGYGGDKGMEESVIENRSGWLPTKEEYVNRLVQEPLAVRLAGEYDIWDKRDPDAEVFQYSLRCCHKLTPELWRALLSFNIGTKSVVKDLLKDGRVCQTYARNVDVSICNGLTWLMEWEGLNFLRVNHARFNSLLFAVKDVPETGHDALLGFRFDGKKWMVSLYHANHRKDIDLSEIAKRHGGGGHRGACGFTCKQLPFNL